MKAVLSPSLRPDGLAEESWAPHARALPCVRASLFGYQLRASHHPWPQTGALGLILQPDRVRNMDLLRLLPGASLHWGKHQMDAQAKGVVHCAFQ